MRSIFSSVLLGAFPLFYYLYKIGPLFLFCALLFGIVGLPIPDEFLLISSGYLVAHQKLNLFSTLLAALFGSACGITISYFLGRLVGKWVIRKWGATLNITEEKVKKANEMIYQIGKWILIIGYFIPVFRHVVGFAAGIARLNFKYFALFAYTGAVIWSMLFFGLGYFFPDWFKGLFSHKSF